MCICLLSINLFSDTSMDSFILFFGSVLLYFVAQIVPALATGSSFNCLLCSFDILTYPHYGVCVRERVYFQSSYWELLLPDIRCS